MLQLNSLGLFFITPLHIQEDDWKRRSSIFLRNPQALQQMSVFSSSNIMSIL